MVSNLLYFMRSGWFVITYYLFSIIWSTYDRSKWSDIRGTWRLYTAIPKSKGFSFDTTRIFYKNDIYTFICFPGILVLFNAWVNYREPLDHKIDPRCFDHEYTHVWICFTDKAITTEQYPRAIEKLSRMIDARSLMRRKLRGNTVNYTDIPLCRS